MDHDKIALSMEIKLSSLPSSEVWVTKHHCTTTKYAGTNVAPVGTPISRMTHSYIAVNLTGSSISILVVAVWVAFSRWCLLSYCRRTLQLIINQLLDYSCYK